MTGIPRQIGVPGTLHRTHPTYGGFETTVDLIEEAPSFEFERWSAGPKHYWIDGVEVGAEDFYRRQQWYPIGLDSAD